jgi:small GTP-binding protein
MSGSDQFSSVSSSSSSEDETPGASATLVDRPADAEFKVFNNGVGGVGKTSFLITFSGSVFPVDYVPTVFDNHTAHVKLGEASVALSLWDSLHRSDYDRLRPLSYPGTDMMVFCIDASNPDSLRAVENKLIPEVVHFVPEARRVLLVLKTDLRDNTAVIEKLKQRREEPLSHEQCASFAKKFGMALLEVSALRGDGMATIGERLVELALEEKRAPKQATGGLGARVVAFVKSMIGI